MNEPTHPTRPAWPLAGGLAAGALFGWLVAGFAATASSEPAPRAPTGPASPAAAPCVASGDERPRAEPPTAADLEELEDLRQVAAELGVLPLSWEDAADPLSQPDAAAAHLHAALEEAGAADRSEVLWRCEELPCFFELAVAPEDRDAVGPAIDDLTWGDRTRWSTATTTFTEDGGALVVGALCGAEDRKRVAARVERELSTATRYDHVPLDPLSPEEIDEAAARWAALQVP